MKRHLSILSCLLAAFAVAACTPQYNAHLLNQGADLLELQDKIELRRQNQWRLPPSTPLYIAMAKNDLIPRAELTITEGIYDALLERFPMSVASSSPASLEGALSEARFLGKGITVFHMLSYSHDQLSSWEEVDGDMGSNTGWGRDRLRLQIQLYDSYTGRLLDSAYLSGISRRIALSSVSPEDLLRLASYRYAQDISSLPGRAH